LSVEHILERVRGRLDEIDHELMTLEKMILMASVGEAAKCLRTMNDLRKERRLLQDVRSSLLGAPGLREPSVNSASQSSAAGDAEGL
jgi:hypothetical protein